MTLTIADLVSAKDLLAAEVKRLRRENSDLRDAVVQACDGGISLRDRRIDLAAIRHVANHLSEPFSWDRVEARVREIRSEYVPASRVRRIIEAIDNVDNAEEVSSKVPVSADINRATTLDLARRIIKAVDNDEEGPLELLPRVVVKQAGALGDHEITLTAPERRAMVDWGRRVDLAMFRLAQAVVAVTAKRDAALADSDAYRSALIKTLPVPNVYCMACPKVCSTAGLVEARWTMNASGHWFCRDCQVPQ